MEQVVPTGPGPADAGPAAASTALVTLAAECGLECCGDLKVDLVAALAQGRDMAVDARAVYRLSTASIQLLVAASLDAERQGLRFTILAPSTALQDTCADLGLSDWLEQRSRA